MINPASARTEQFIYDLKRIYGDRTQPMHAVDRAHTDALLRLAAATAFRDGDTGAHILRTGFLCEALALKMGLSSDFAVLLGQTAPMHDVGKIGIPDHILKKPGLLTDLERAVMDTHPSIGAEIIGHSDSPLLQTAAECALTHHERFDGKGYPAGLCGEEIPLSGRILAVVDVFDALVMDRVYRSSVDIPTTLRMLARQRGLAFDPEVLDVFLAHADEFVALRDAISTPYQPAHGKVINLPG